MPKYFFRVRQNGEVLPDDGEADWKPEKPMPLRVPREILSDAAFVGNAASLNTQIEVEDENGARLFVVPCGRVVDTDAQRQCSTSGRKR